MNKLIIMSVLYIILYVGGTRISADAESFLLGFLAGMFLMIINFNYK